MKSSQTEPRIRGWANEAARHIAVGRVIRGDLERAVLGSEPQISRDVVGVFRHVQRLRAQWVGSMDNVYRVYLSPDTNHIEVICLGIDSIDSEAEGIYSNTSELPAWMQERLAVLSLMKVDPPQTKVEGVGMRVDEHVYWIIKG